MKRTLTTIMVLCSLHHELHRGVIVVQEQHAVETGAFGLRLGLGNDRCARRARAPALGVVIVVGVVIVSQTRPPWQPGGRIHFGSFSDHGNFTGHDVAALGQSTQNRVDET